MACPAIESPYIQTEPAQGGKPFLFAIGRQDFVRKFLEQKRGGTSRKCL
jgi:hypothetical protein